MITSWRLLSLFIQSRQTKIDFTQMSVLLTFAPPMSGRILNNGASFMLRRVFRVVIKRLINDDLSESDADKSRWSNLSLCLPSFMLLQRVGDEPNMRRRAKLFTTLRSGDALSVKVGDFLRE